MRQCDILVTEEDGQVVAGVIILEGTTLSYAFNPDHELMMSRIMTSSSIGLTKRLWAKDDPVDWFDNLPNAYTSSMVRALILPDDDSKRMRDLAVELNMELPA